MHYKHIGQLRYSHLFRKIRDMGYLIKFSYHLLLLNESIIPTNHSLSFKTYLEVYAPFASKAP